MSVRRVNKDGDWDFGQGLSNYATKGEEVRQNVVTRIKSFKNDWYLDTEAEIDWLNILSNLGNKQQILLDIENTTLATDGVKDLLQLSIDDVTQRSATITLVFTTIYDDEFKEQIGIFA